MAWSKSEFDHRVEALANPMLRRVLLAIFLGLTALFVYSATHLKVDAGFSKMVPLEHEYMRTFTEYQKTFGGANRVLVALRVKGAEGRHLHARVHARAERCNRRRVLHSRRRPGDRDLAVHAQRSLHRGRRRGVFRRQRGTRVVPRHAGRPRHRAPERAQVGQRRTAGGQRLPRRLDPRRAARGRSGFRAAAELPCRRQSARGGARQVRRATGSTCTSSASPRRSAISPKVPSACSRSSVSPSSSRRFSCTSTTGPCGSPALALVAALMPVVWLLGLLPILGYGIDPMSILVPFLIFSIGVSHAVQMTNVRKQATLMGLDSQDAALNAFLELFIPGSVALLHQRARLPRDHAHQDRRRPGARHHRLPRRRADDPDEQDPPADPAVVHTGSSPAAAAGDPPLRCGMARDLGVCRAARRGW